MTPEVQIERSRSLRTIGRYDEAVLAARQACALDPEHFGACVELGWAELGADHPDAALQAAARASVLRPEDHLPQVNRYDAHRALGDHKKSLAAAWEAVALRPDLSSNHVFVAYALGRCGEKTNAIDEAETAVRLDPESASALIVLGYSLIRNRRIGQAEQPLRAALAIEPESTAAKKYLAIVLQFKGQAAEAMALTSALVRDRPDDGSSLDMLVGNANAYARQGPINRAIPQLLRYAWLRVPIAIALLLAPFAIVERWHRRRHLPDGLTGVVELARESPVRKRVRRERRRTRWRGRRRFLCVVAAGLVTVALLVFVSRLTGR